MPQVLEKSDADAKPKPNIDVSITSFNFRILDIIKQLSVFTASAAENNIDNCVLLWSLEMPVMKLDVDKNENNKFCLHNSPKKTGEYLADSSIENTFVYLNMV